MKWIATCPHETVGVLERELRALGASVIDVLHRGVSFDCDLETAYRAHLLLRTASRIQRVVAEFPASGPDGFRKELRNIKWTDWLRNQRPFNVDTALTDRDSQSWGEDAVKRAVADSVTNSAFEKFPPKYDPENENSVTIVVFARNGNCVIGIDTAGRALHKRGWRMNGHPAVLKETLAASILLLAGYDGTEPLLDPMCGSGTIVIEAAYIALGKAPLIHRGKDDFALEHTAGFDRPLWRKVSDQLRAAKKAELPAPIYASDIQAKYVELARDTSLKARVEKYIQFSVKPFREWEAPAEKGLLVANLPYGERIGRTDLAPLFRDTGRVIMEKFSKWRYALLVPADSPVRELGLKAVKEIPLLNGALPVKLIVS